jgi:imidazolonepropionase-like amidohydrolase
MEEDNLARLADAGIAWVPTIIPMAALADDPSLIDRRRDTALRTLEHQLEQVHRGHRLGVPIVLGTDAGSVGVDHALAVPLEMAWLKEAGLSVEDIVFSAGGRAARLLGLSDRNVIAPGERADFVMVRGGPADVVAGMKAIDGICVGGCFDQQGITP